MAVKVLICTNCTSKLPRKDGKCKACGKRTMHWFHSASEGERFAYLKRQPHISKIECQHKYPLRVPLDTPYHLFTRRKLVTVYEYNIDFFYKNELEDSHDVFEEFKPSEIKNGKCVPIINKDAEVKLKWLASAVQSYAKVIVSYPDPPTAKSSYSELLIKPAN